MDYRIHLAARFENVAVKAPFAGRMLSGVGGAIQFHEDDLFDLHRVIGR